MRFRHELAYDAPPAEVLAMINDPLFWDKVGEANAALSCTATVGTEGETTRVTIDQEQKVVGVPSFAKKFVGDHIRIVQAEAWTSPERAVLEVEIPGKPGHLKGEITLKHGSGTVETVSGEIKVHVPMLGGKLEKLIGDLLGAALDTEQKIGRAWLAGER
jgi:hypothetical protein